MQKMPILFEEADILVVGDVMLDRYVWGQVKRISPEAPVPVVQAQRTTETLGGAGNVAYNLAALNCRVSLIGVCGADPTARSLRDLLTAKRIDDLLVVDPARPTTTKTRIMAHKQQILRLDDEQVHPMDAEIIAAIRNAFSTGLERCNAVILSDYGKGVLAETSFVQEMIHACRSRSIPVLVDPKGMGWQRYRGASGVTPNTAELEAVVGSALVSSAGT